MRTQLYKELYVDIQPRDQVAARIMGMVPQPYNGAGPVFVFDSGPLSKTAILVGRQWDPQSIFLRPNAPVPSRTPSYGTHEAAARLFTTHLPSFPQLHGCLGIPLDIYAALPEQRSSLVRIQTDAERLKLCGMDGQLAARWMGHEIIQTTLRWLQQELTTAQASNDQPKVEQLLSDFGPILRTITEEANRKKAARNRADNKERKLMGEAQAAEVRGKKLKLQLERKLGREVSVKDLQNLAPPEQSNKTSSKRQTKR